MKQQITSDQAMRDFGERLGHALSGNEIIELVGDVGAGKTTLVKGLALGLSVDDDIQSPTFTISRIYETKEGGILAHYDFYRLSEPGILQDEIAESIADPQSIVVIEWGDIVEGVLPADRLTIRIESPTESTRDLEITSGGLTSDAVLEKLQ